MIDRTHKLSVVRQAKLLGFSRGNVYYSPRPVSDCDLALMRRIDELHLDWLWCIGRGVGGFRTLVLSLSCCRLTPDGFRACACHHAIEGVAADGDFRLLCCE